MNIPLIARLFAYPFDLIRNYSRRRVVRRNTPPQVPIQDDNLAAYRDERTFLASIAHLPPSEQQQRIQRRRWYRQSAERQGVMEAERQAEHTQGL